MGDAVAAMNVDPFILAALFTMSEPTFPPHPHAGFIVATYMLPESPIGFVNQDSTGLVNQIEPGAIHFTVAGSGTLHEEQPERAGPIASGFQIWVDLPNDRRDIAPYAVSLAADAVPIARAAGVEIRVLAGSSNGLRAPIDLPTPLRIVDLTLNAGGSFTQELEPGENAFLIMHAGDVLVAGEHVEAGQLVRTDCAGGDLNVTAGERPARLTLFAGMPLSQRREMAGPIVARDGPSLRDLMARARRGGFGTLIPFAVKAAPLTHNKAAIQ
ncbi:MAG TPA: pirin-like C-terminal cupin domain-containing protein [Sphingobium sp.]